MNSTGWVGTKQMEYCDFKRDELLGHGGFGRVFQVELQQGKKLAEIAIKEVFVEVCTYVYKESLSITGDFHMDRLELWESLLCFWAVYIS